MLEARALRTRESIAPLRDHRLTLALEVHAELAQLIKPATPESIRASTWRNRSLASLLGLSLVSFVGFIVPPLVGMTRDAELTGHPDSLFGVLHLLGAAGLGSGFYALHTATRFLRNRTFDPTYNQIYLVRFVLGILAGFILGTFANELFDPGALRYGRPLLALVGGFAGDSVAQILQRVADTLLTIVRGNEKDRIQLQTQAQATERDAKLAAELSEALSDPSNLDARIREISKRLAASS